MNCPAEFIALAERMAEASGKIVRRYFRTSVEIVTKADASPVTIADRETETALRQMVKLAYPDQVARVQALMARPPLCGVNGIPPAELLVDATGVGLPVAQQFERAQIR